MRTNLSRALVALLALVGLSGALSACDDGYGGYQPMAYAQACIDDFGNRAPDFYCDSPHPHYYSAWGSIHDDGDYIPGYGRPLLGWSRSRPANYNVNTTIVHVNPSGGSINRTGTGSGITRGSTIGSGKSIPTAPKGYSATSSARKDNAPSTGSSTITRGGLGVSSGKSSSSSSSSSSSGSKSSSSSSSSKSGK